MRTIVGWSAVNAVAELVLLAAVAGADDKDKKISLDEAPKAVQDAIKARFPGADVTSIEKENEGGKVVYDVELKHKGRKYEMDIQEDGTIIEIEKEIAARDLPEAVSKGIEARYPRATLKEVMEVYKVRGKDEKLAEYEVTLETADKKTVEVKVSLDGKTVKGEGGEMEAHLAGWTADFSAEKADLVSTGRNPYFILEPGYFLVLENGDEQLTVTVLDETKKVDGVDCRVVEEKEAKGGTVKEKSRNYFAINKRTNSIFYFGEDAGGAWLSGEKGAKFGLMIPGTPLLKGRYYQEVAPGVAMDRAEIVGTAETVVTPAGTFKNCLKTEETTPLDAKEKEHKFYAAGMGLVQEGELKLVKYGSTKNSR
jgi:uncharacterized membrane protein YkoI